jgi:hypothetical protein
MGDLKGAQEMLNEYMDSERSALFHDEHFIKGDPVTGFVIRSMFVPMYNALDRYDEVLSICTTGCHLRCRLQEPAEEESMFWFAGIELDWLGEYNRAEDLLKLAVIAYRQSRSSRNTVGDGNGRILLL